MALYRLRKWITPSIYGNKINRNLFMALSGTQRCDSWHLQSFRYYFSLVCLFTLSPPRSCTLHPLSPTESGWPGTSAPTDNTASDSQTGAVCSAEILGKLYVDSPQPTVMVSSPHSHLRCVIGTFENHSSQKLMGDYFLSQCWSQWKVHECSSQINKLGVMHGFVFFTWLHQQLSLAWKGQSIIIITCN